MDESSVPGPSKNDGEAKRKGCGCLPSGFLLIVTLALLWSVALRPIGPGIQNAPHNAAMQQARQLGLLLSSYASDHDGKYPDGQSSTEIFQHLLDDGYVSDPRVFYIPMTGKTQPAELQKKLKPENVCFDVTGDTSPHESEFLPLVFLTGYRMMYAPEGGAARVPSSHLLYRDSDSFFRTTDPEPGLAVAFNNGSAFWISAHNPSVMDGMTYSLQNLIPADFDAHGKTFRQLTPDGVLPAESK